MSGKIINRNRFFDPAPAPAKISATVTGTGFTVVAFLDRGVADFKKFSAAQLSNGLSQTLTDSGLHILEFVIAFTKATEASCDISCTLDGADGSTQTLKVPVTGKKADIARVSFHAQID